MKSLIILITMLQAIGGPLKQQPMVMETNKLIFQHEWTYEHVMHNMDDWESYVLSIDDDEKAYDEIRRVGYMIEAHDFKYGNIYFESDDVEELIDIAYNEYLAEKR